MKSIAIPLLAIAIASTLAACTPPDDAQNAAAQPAPAPEAAAEPAPPAATSALPALRALDDAQRAETLATSTNCNLESADAQPFAGDDVTLTTLSSTKVTGWLKNDRAGVAVEGATLRFETIEKSQVWEVPLTLSIARDDLSPTQGQSTPTPGFEVVFDASALPTGRYHLYLAYRADGVLSGCDNGRYIVVP